jgi:hypothetical protein
MPDGSCAPVDQVAYVDPLLGGDSGGGCSLNAPCKLIMDALKKARPVLKLTGMSDEQVLVKDQAVTMLADPGTQLTRTSSPGIIMTIDGTSVVQIVDLTIAGGLGSTGSGISLPLGNGASLSLLRARLRNNAGGGLAATGSVVTISQSTISGNTGGITTTGGSTTISRSLVTNNTQSGISVSGSQFDITNSIVAGNGGAQTAFGGVRFDQTNSGLRKFEFNTVTNNVAADGAAVGVVCTLVTQPVTLSNNIIHSNQVGGTRTQVGGLNCNWSFSDIGPDTVVNTGNINMDPIFVNPSQGDFHLQSTSPVKDKADPGATTNVDIDGDARPQGSGFDMGADEIK